jgi:CTP:molybdopterin cytidylyltransferase MocA
MVVAGLPGGEMEKTICSAFVHESRLSFAHNMAASSGQMSSVKAGLRALPPGVDAAAVFLGDMPFVGADIIDSLLDTHRRIGGFVVPVCKEAWRHPRVIPARHFDDFLALRDDEKGAGIFDQFRSEVRTVMTGEEWNFADVDTVEDLARAERFARL